MGEFYLIIERDKKEKYNGQLLQEKMRGETYKDQVLEMLSSGAGSGCRIERAPDGRKTGDI